MRGMLSEILDLQKQFSDANTPAMERRGIIIRRELPEWLRKNAESFALNLKSYAAELAVQGRDGTGRKTLVPWVRVFSLVRSPSAQVGWYVVYLFRPDGEAVSLCLVHGSTIWTGTEFQPRGAEEARKLMDWSRGIVVNQAQALGLDVGVHLGSTQKLAVAYESTTAFSKTYARSLLPNNQTLLDDLSMMLNLLQQLYYSVDMGREPGTPSAEVVEAIGAIEKIAKPNKVANGQGYGLTAQQRQAVDRRAMRVAEDWLRLRFNNILDVHLREPCDFRIQDEEQSIVVEVKGTTGGPDSILLTHNEVDLHRSNHPLNILLIIHGIDLDRVQNVASGGTLIAFQPWLIEEDRLRPTAYQYALKGAHIETDST